MRPTRARHLTNAIGKRVTVAALARDAGVSRSLLSKLLDGRRAPTADVLARLARATGLTATTLVRIFRRAAEEP